MWSGNPIFVAPLSKVVQPKMVIATRQSKTQTLCKITVTSPSKKVIYPVDTVIALSSVIFMVLPNKFAKTDCRPRIRRRLPKNLAKKTDISISKYNCITICKIKTVQRKNLIFLARPIGHVSKPRNRNRIRLRRHQNLFLTNSKLNSKTPASLHSVKSPSPSPFASSTKPAVPGGLGNPVLLG